MAIDDVQSCRIRYYLYVYLTKTKDKPTRNIEVDTLKELAIEVLKNYTDFEEKYDTD